MNDSIKILMDEHKLILRVIENIENECEGIKRGNPLNVEFFKAAIDFIRNYADKLHHAKEEDILFKEFCKNEENLHCNPVEQMLHEHELGRGFIGAMEDGVNEKNSKKVVENALNYCELLKDHIYKEDNIMYPMSEEIINGKIWTGMLKKFKEIDLKRKSEIKKYTDFAKKSGRYTWTYLKKQNLKLRKFT